MSTPLLKGVAFITGAGSGIGQYTAYAFAKHGITQLALCDIRPETLKETTAHLKTINENISVLEVEADVSNESDVQNAISKTLKTFGRIDIAVNNAGIGHAPKHTADVEFSEFQKVFSVNLNGVWLCQRAQIRQMLTQDYLSPPPRGNRGVIINVASMLGHVGSSPGTPAAAYTSSKHAVVGLTKTDAVAYAPQGIKINAMCPGYVATPLLKGASDSGAMGAEVAKVPQQRLGEMEEIADSIVFLASPMSSFMTGASLIVDGGYTAQ